MVKKVKKKTNKMTYDQFKDIQDKKDLMNRITCLFHPSTNLFLTISYY